MKSLRGDEQNIAAQWLAVARLIVILADDGAIAVAEGSAFDQAWTLMLEMGFGNEGVCDEIAADEMAVWKPACNFDPLTGAIGVE